MRIQKEKLELKGENDLGKRHTKKKEKEKEIRYTGIVQKHLKK